MNEGLGSVVLIEIIVVFIVVASSYMAFNVNYQKAFKMKNKIIELYERYDGDCNNTSTKCYQKVKSYAKEIGYKPDNLKCDGLGEKVGDLYCNKAVTVKKTSSSSSIEDIKTGTYYNITTRINISIPIIDNVMNLSWFNVTGSTKIIYK